MHKPSVISLGAGLMVALTCATDAGAVNQDRTSYTNPAGICQGALPVFDGLIRKRPLALQNEATSPAFVTCSYTTQGQATRVRQYVNTTGGVSAMFSCTAVTGWATGTNLYVTKSVQVGPTSGQDVLEWLPADFGAGTLPNLISVSCNLPPGAALNDAWLDFYEGVGL